MNQAIRVLYSILKTLVLKDKDTAAQSLRFPMADLSMPGISLTDQPDIYRLT